jgi:two-component system response regulator CpxR
MTEPPSPSTASEGHAHRLLLVDDDRALCDMLVEYLAPEGFRIETVHDGRHALERLRKDGPDLVILDVMLPGLSGLDVLRALRARRQTPVLMLTARGDDVDRIVGLEIGADDYLAKPFNPRELVARIRAILRRSASAPVSTAGANAAADDGRLEAGGIVLDEKRHEASRDGTRLMLTGAEFRVLALLLRRAGSVVSRAELTEQALGRPMTPFDRAIDTHVSNLRGKLGRGADGSSPIRNIRGAGYLFAAVDAPSPPGPGG